MLEESPSESIADSELLARFILFGKWFRSSDLTVKSEAFEEPDLSVFRHIGLSDIELWVLGQDVANLRSSGKLYGRVDLTVRGVRNLSLEVQNDTPPRNHALIVRFPKDKATRKMIALELARAFPALIEP